MAEPASLPLINFVQGVPIGHCTLSSFPRYLLHYTLHVLMDTAHVAATHRCNILMLKASRQHIGRQLSPSVRFDTRAKNLFWCLSFPPHQCAWAILLVRFSQVCFTGLQSVFLLSGFGSWVSSWHHLNVLLRLLKWCQLLTTTSAVYRDDSPTALVMWSLQLPFRTLSYVSVQLLSGHLVPTYGGQKIVAAIIYTNTNTVCATSSNSLILMSFELHC